jgi:hypothetical protein
MPEIILKLVPGRLENPDLDLRYEIPNLLEERSAGQIQDNGYDYANGSDAILLFLTTQDLESAVPIVLEVIRHERVCDNDLSSVIVATGEEGSYTIIHPPGCEESLDLNEE